MNKFRVYGVIVYNFGHFREVPSEPLLEPHAKGVDVFVHLVDERNRLNNWLVLAVDVLSASVARVRVSKTELGALDVRFVDFYN